MTMTTTAGMNILRTDIKTTDMTTKDIERYLRKATFAPTSEEHKQWILLGIFRVLSEIAAEIGAIEEEEEDNDA